MLASEEKAAGRLKRFRAAHPTVLIIEPGPMTGGVWRAIYRGQEVASALWLRHLMDKLEAQYE